MGWLHGLLGLGEDNYRISTQIGQDVVYDAVTAFLERVNNDMALATELFVEETTESYLEKYELPGGGYLQRKSSATRTGRKKALGSWQVAYPLDDFGDGLAVTRVEMGYMGSREFEKHVEGIVTAAANTVRREILARIFNNTSYVFEDPHHGELTIQPLANGDATIFPPVLGTDTEATDNHYLTTTYAAGAIDNTNNPYVTISEKLFGRFGRSTGGQNVMVFINPAQATLTRALADFVAVTDIFVNPGDDTATLLGVAALPPTAEIIGRVDSCWVVVWDYIPATYMVAIHADQPAPLKRRVDPAVTGLPRGLTLLNSSDENPLIDAEWGLREGYGTGNRLNGIVLQLRGDANPYAPPAAYTDII